MTGHSNRTWDTKACSDALMSGEIAASLKDENRDHKILL